MATRSVSVSERSSSTSSRESDSLGTPALGLAFAADSLSPTVENRTRLGSISVNGVSGGEGVGKTALTGVENLLSAPSAKPVSCGVDGTGDPDAVLRSLPSLPMASLPGYTGSIAGPSDGHSCQGRDSQHQTLKFIINDRDTNNISLTIRLRRPPMALANQAAIRTS